MNAAKVVKFPNVKKSSVQDKKEAELIARISHAEEPALKELFCIYYGRLYRFISRINGGLSIDEIINDVMYVVWQKAGTYNQLCLPSTWIFGIAYNKARQSARRLQDDRVESLDSIERDSPELGIIDTGLQQLEMSDLLGEAFKDLSPDQRAVVELTYFHGLSYKEISKVMDCSENTVKTRMFYARIKLSKVFRKAGPLV